MQRVHFNLQTPQVLNTQLRNDSNPFLISIGSLCSVKVRKAVSARFTGTERVDVFTMVGLNQAC